MDFSIGEETREMITVTRRALDRAEVYTSTRSPAGDGQHLDRQRWRALCALGLTSIRVEAPDGPGLDLLDASALVESIGAVLLPEPVVETATLAMLLTRGAARDGEVLPADISSGARLAAFAPLADPLRRAPSGRISGTLRATFVDDVDCLVAVARSDAGRAGLAMLEVPGPDARQGVDDGDPTRPRQRLAFHDAAPHAFLPIDNEALQRARQEAVVLVAAELVGSMARALAETVDYVARRQQFGRAIGSFQAVKHQCADMFVALEQARALVQSAAITVHEKSATAARDVSAVAGWVPAAAIDNAAKAVHLHGGMGYAWESGLHLHLRRAVAVQRVVGGRRPNASAVLADLIRCTPQQVPA